MRPDSAANSSAASPPESPERALVRGVRRMAQAIELRSREIVRLTGLTIPQLVVLQSVQSLGQVTTQAVSRDAAMSPPTVVAVLDRLEAKGLVERYRSTRDRRIVHLRLTDAGRQALTDSPGLLGDGFMTAFSRLALQERQQLAQSIERMASLMTGTAAGTEAPTAAPEA